MGIHINASGLTGFDSLGRAPSSLAVKYDLAALPHRQCDGIKGRQRQQQCAGNARFVVLARLAHIDENNLACIKSIGGLLRRPVLHLYLQQMMVLKSAKPDVGAN